ncbi:hypothetical protein TRAPUB_6155 [Trametes pubescens]|uniref:Uncharacterized protein n=1 Tax=Trametes pubescens TaxID=154538 RepID=A0A1M2V6J0_TRAPU|nr:hypothetical protein TRAPUB_6155 [Trametes pubescens]
MATPQDPNQSNVFDPPRLYIDDDGVFPPGTVVTRSDDHDLQTTLVKQQDGTYHADDSTEPAILGFPFEDTHIYIGAIATIFDPVTGALVAEYVKQPNGTWKLASTTDTAAVTDGGLPVDILPQADYSAPKPPDVPVIKYGGMPLSKILQDKGASVGDAECPAYDGGVVGSPKLSLRLLLQNITYKSAQFTARTEKKGLVRVITRGKLAMYIAEQLRDTLTEAEQQGKCLCQADGTRVDFDRLVLMDVAFHSKASIQPRIGVIRAE